MSNKEFNFAEEIAPYQETVHTYLKGQGVPSYPIRMEISEIYDNLRRKESLDFYGSQNVEIYPTDQGCAKCVTRMFKDLAYWIAKGSIEFKGIKDQVKTDDAVTVVVDLPGDLSATFEPEVVKHNEGVITIDPSQFKWGEFKTYCKEEGINVRGKTRKVLEKELSEL